MGEEPDYRRFLPLSCWNSKNCEPLKEGDYRGRTVSILNEETEYQIGAFFVGNLTAKDTHQLKHLLLLTDLYESPFGSLPSEKCPMVDQHLRLHDYSALTLDEAALDYIAEAMIEDKILGERMRTLGLEILSDLKASGEVGKTLGQWFTSLLDRERKKLTAPNTTTCFNEPYSDEEMCVDKVESVHTPIEE